MLRIKVPCLLQIKQLSEELSAAVGEKERLLSERSDRHDVMEKMKADVTSLTEERDQLQETLQQLETDNIQIKTHRKRRIDGERIIIITLNYNTCMRTSFKQSPGHFLH